MAHRGRHFPVNFRRDFNQNCDISNVNAAAETYRVVVHSGVLPPYPIDGTVFICTPTVSPASAELRWLSELKFVGGFNWQLLGILIFPFVPDTKLSFSWTMLRIGRGSVAQWFYHSPSYNDPFTFESGFAKTVNVDAGVFPRGAFFENSTTTPVGY
jgi:hypothetical protein